MPSFDSDVTTKLAQLAALRAGGTDIQVYEIVGIDWPSPTGPVYYSRSGRETMTQLSTLSGDLVAPPVSPIDTRLLLEDGDPFLPINQSSSIGDEEVDLKFSDLDGEFSDLLIEHGEGIKTTFYYWFPQVELLLPMWEGHLQSEEDGDVEAMPVIIAQGLRSADLEIPKRAHWETCQAIFGGLLSAAEALAMPECPYNLHRGGSIGTEDPDTSEPWTFCPRLTTANCVERGVDPLRHLSFRTIVATVLGTQGGRPPTFSTSEGNETNLEKPVRVVMGDRRIYDCKVLAFIRHPVLSNPDHGFFEAIYEVCEGPIGGTAFIRIEVDNVQQYATDIHLSQNLGNLGQPAISNSVTTHGFSGTALIRYNFGWVNPEAVDQNDARLTTIVYGLRDIRQYIDEGAGLVAEYFSDSAFTTLAHRRIDLDINYALQTGPPAPGVPPTGFSVRRTGYITFEWDAEYTITLDHDDSGRVVIDGDEIINNINVGTDSGTFTAMAGVPYEIIVDHVQGNAAGNHPWEIILYWEQAEKDVAFAPIPSSAFTHDATYILSGTNNRAWQIARMLTDKRWGFGYDYDRLDIPSFQAAAEWVAEYVRYTDFAGNTWDHFRGLSNVDLQAKKVQQQIEDMCLAGRLSRPFLFNGKIHIVPLSALTEDELDECPVFTDEGESGRNIIWGESKSTLRYSRASSFSLYNRVECTYDSADADYLKTPCAPVEDEDLQLAAGRSRGDTTREVKTLKEDLLGVIHEAHAIKLSWSFLDLGRFDEGGIQNNLRIKFRTWFESTLTLHPFKVIKVVNTRMNTKYGFEYFRIMSIERQGNLEVEIEAQAYNVEYMDNFETSTDEPAIVSPGFPESICGLAFGSGTKLENGLLTVEVEDC